MAKTTIITDFGQKIGGAKKDMWRNRRLSVEDLDILDSVDRQKFVKKDMIWKKPDYQKMKDEGVPVTVIYFIKTLRDAIPASPKFYTEESVRNYINGVTYLEESVSNITVDEIESYYKNKFVNAGLIFSGYGRYVTISDKYMDVINNRVLRAAQSRLSELSRNIQKKKFLFSEEDITLSNYDIRLYSEDTHEWSVDYSKRVLLAYKPSRYSTFFVYPQGEYLEKDAWTNNTWYAIKKSNRAIVINNCESYESLKQFVLDNSNPEEQKTIKVGKKRYSVKKLTNLSRKGDSSESSMCIPEFLQITGDDIISDFGIKGGEFGVWVSEDEKQLNMNWAYLSFVDLAAALNIPTKSISINGELSIAFGSRGSGNALAHYELDRRVINLTRMKGAGSLAHEWGHAIDFIAKDTLGRKYYDVTKKLREAFWYKKDGSSQSDFFINSQKMDKMYSKSGHGYWSSTEELFARAFACYVADKLEEKGRHNLYLHGHSEDAMTIDGEYAVPKGEERQYINECFDEYFKTLIEEDVL